jgi:hypothetical protein
MDKLHDAKLQLIVYTMHLIVTQLQFSQKKSFSTTIQLHYNYTHEVMLTSLIVIHILKLDMWHYEKIWTLIFFEILISIAYYNC